MSEGQRADIEASRLAPDLAQTGMCATIRIELVVWVVVEPYAVTYVFRRQGWKDSGPRCPLSRPARSDLAIVIPINNSIGVIARILMLNIPVLALVLHPVIFIIGVADPGRPEPLHTPLALTSLTPCYAWADSAHEEGAWLDVDANAGHPFD